MNLKSKNASLIILGATAIVLSRALFVFFNDPEGPNLLVVIVTAAIVYLLSLAVYKYFPSKNTEDTNKKFWIAVLSQVIIVLVFYFGLR